MIHQSPKSRHAHELVCGVIGFASNDAAQLRNIGMHSATAAVEVNNGSGIESYADPEARPALLECLSLRVLCAIF